jgi:hypothetical protein
MKTLIWIGLAIVTLGVASLLIPIPGYERNGVNLGGVSIGVETRHDEKVSSIVSAAMILGSAVLMTAGLWRSQQAG